MFDRGRLEGDGGSGVGRTPGRVLADRIVAREARIRAEEVGTVLDLKAWMDLHSVDPSDPLAKGVAGGSGRRAGSDGTPLVDEHAVYEYAKLRRQADGTARAFLTDVADLEHRFPRLWAAVMALTIPVWQARKIAAACRELSKEAAGAVDDQMAAVAPGLPWGRILTLLGVAIMHADPALAEKKRQHAKSARFVRLCRSEDGINTLIARADQGDLVMVYALVDRLADILALEGSTEAADERRATAFGLLAQPAMILELLLRHADGGTSRADERGDQHQSSATAGTPGPGDPPTDNEKPTNDRADESRDSAADGRISKPRSESEPAPVPPPDPHAEPPEWTADDDDEPDDPTPIDHPNIPDHWQQRVRPRPAPEPPAPVWDREPDDPEAHPPDGSGLCLDPPGLTDQLRKQGLRAARPRVVLNVFLTDQTLRTGEGAVRTDHADLGPMLATQLREFLINHSCHITLRPVLDVDRVPAVDAYEIPQRIRDAVRLRHVASVFPYSGATSARMDLDHTNPYRWDGATGQTGPANLAPLARGEHNAKTHGRWTVRSPHPGVFLWRSPHGHWFLCTNQGTQPLGPRPES
jgi:hypothetical protein